MFRILLTMTSNFTSFHSIERVGIILPISQNNAIVNTKRQNSKSNKRQQRERNATALGSSHDMKLNVTPDVNHHHQKHQRSISDQNVLNLHF